MLLRKLASTRAATEQLQVWYDENEKVSYVLEEDVWTPSFNSSRVGDTKKADMETGEDQKGQ